MAEAEQTDAVDRSGISIFRALQSFQPARQLILESLGVWTDSCRSPRRELRGKAAADVWPECREYYSVDKVHLKAHMSDLSTVMAKLSGVRKALAAAMNENVSRRRSGGEVQTRTNFAPDQVQHHFTQAASYLAKLKELLPDLYGDFQEIESKPTMTMVAGNKDLVPPVHFSRPQLERLVRDIDQIFEIRANSELEQPKRKAPRCVFITHGRSNDWRVVQSFIEKDVDLPTIKLAQEANLGRTIIEKLIDYADRCDSAVIVMTGDDVANGHEARVRENVMHEIGFFQGRYGRRVVILLHEEGVNIPTNLSGVAYIPFPKGRIEAGFHVLQRELRAIYNS